MGRPPLSFSHERCIHFHSVRQPVGPDSQQLLFSGSQSGIALWLYRRLVVEVAHCLGSNTPSAVRMDVVSVCGVLVCSVFFLRVVVSPRCHNSFSLKAFLLALIPSVTPHPVSLLS